MTEIKSLYDVKIGDVVAHKINKNYPKWEKTTVDKVTAKYITVRSSTLLFKKENGAATKNQPDIISIVTPEIQEKWDVKHYTELIHTFLESNHVSSTTLKQIMNILEETIMK